MKNIQITPVGIIEAEDNGFLIRLDEKFVPALTEIDGFNHLQIVWWGNLYDKSEYRNNLVIDKPYKKGPEKLGVFATRSPVRPNPVLLTTIHVINIDHVNGIIRTPYIDAEPGTPVLDIKPYHPSERVKNCTVPEWCSNWPEWYEDSASFDWQSEFNF